MRFRMLLFWLICALCLAGMTGCDEHEELVILTDQLPNGRVGVAYGFALEVEGDADEFLFVAGMLPPGIDFSIDGEFGGVPSQAGSFTFKVEAIDLSSQGIEDRTSKGFVLVIEE